jgi:hypothetical protein
MIKWQRLQKKKDNVTEEDYLKAKKAVLDSLTE